MGAWGTCSTGLEVSKSVWGVGDALGYGTATARRSKRGWGPGSVSKTPVRTWPVLPRTQGKPQTWSPHARPLFQKQTGIQLCREDIDGRPQSVGAWLSTLGLISEVLLAAPRGRGALVEHTLPGPSACLMVFPTSPASRKNRIFPWSRRPSAPGPQPPGWVSWLFPMSGWLSVDLAVGERVGQVRGSAPSCTFLVCGAHGEVVTSTVAAGAGVS